MPQLQRRWAIPALASVILVLPSAAQARSAIERGTIVRIEAGEAYFDVGAARGVKPGDPLRVRRPITLRHPVSGKPVRDELPVGELEVGAVGQSLSMAVVPTTLAGQVAVGQVVEILVERPGPPPPPPPPEPVAEPAPPREDPLPAVDPATAAVLATWEQTSGATLEERIAAWRRYLEANPSSPYVARVREDLATLAEYRKKLMPAPDRIAEEEPVVGGVHHHAPRTAPHGERVGLALATERPAGLAGAWVHFRRRGSDTFRKAELHRDGDGYLRGAVPAGEVAAPGFEYFVEVATVDGTAGTAAGTPRAPLAVRVEEPPAELFVERQNRSRVQVNASYLDFASFDRRPDHQGDPDYVYMFEADFLYRLRTTLYGIRTGFGVIQGEGGYANQPGPEAAFTYGYTELELHGGPNLGWLLRLVTGVGPEGLGFGAEGRLRVGLEQATNLTFALSTLEDIGFLSEVRLQWHALESFPLGFAVALTDQPNNGDLGVRLSTDIGVRLLPWAQPTVRLSYQGRTVTHSGLGAGLGLVFDW